MPKTKRPIDPRNKNQSLDLEFESAPTMSEFLWSVANDIEKDGQHKRYHDKEEICIFGCRGDGKTIGALAAMIWHANAHHANGYPLPVPWMGVTDTFTGHKLKTIRTMEAPLWKGGWRLMDMDHVAVFMLNGVPMIKLDLFGIEDQGAMDRVRMETCGVWFEEVAPAAVMVDSHGVSESAWLLALTSRRVPSHYKPAIITTNYPDEDHWSWQRFIVNPSDNSMYFRVPPGERASAEDREKNLKALEGRPDLQRRLLLGEPGIIMLGDQVAQGFRRDLHVSCETLLPRNHQPLFFGFDFGHTPTCVIAQEIGRIEILAALHIQGAGMQQLMEEKVMPWLGRFAPWVLNSPDEYALVGYDPSGKTGSQHNIDDTAIQVIQDELGGGWFEPGPVQWNTRKDALLRVFNRINAISINPGPFTDDLIRALDGRWYYPKSHQGVLKSDRPHKPNHPWEDLGDALIYCLCRIGVVSTANENPSTNSGKVITNIQYGT